MKIIFLDFDGVLATDEYTDSLISLGLKTHDYFGTLFNPICVGYLSKIILATEAKIVVTSDWRNYLNPLMLRIMWLYRKMPGKIVGCTLRKGIHRGLQINKWLNAHKNVKSYVILDDMNETQFLKTQISNLVVTPHFSGLDNLSANRAIEILTRL